MAARKEVRLLLKVPVWELLRTEFAKRLGIEDPASGVRAVLHLWLKKHGHDLGATIDHVPDDLPTQVGTAPWAEDSMRRCKKCRQVLPIAQFNHPDFHTVCAICAYRAQSNGDKRPGTPTRYLAAQYHYKLCRAEWVKLNGTSTTENPVPDWMTWYKRQDYRRAKHERDYYATLRGKV